MFLIQKEHRLPLQSAVAGGDVMSMTEQLSIGELLVLQLKSPGAHGVPTVIWMDLNFGAGSLGQFLEGNAKVRGAAIVSTLSHRPSGEWHLEQLSEIRIGATEYSEKQAKLLSVTQFTTVAGRKFTVPYAVATRRARGRRVMCLKTNATSDA